MKKDYNTTINDSGMSRTTISCSPKAIAEIINKSRGTAYNFIRAEFLANKLADYFERESSRGSLWGSGIGKSTGVINTSSKFDKKQFLKDCGLK